MIFEPYRQPWEMSGLDASVLSAGVMSFSRGDIDYWNRQDDVDWTIAAIRRWDENNGRFAVVARRRDTRSAP